MRKPCSCPKTGQEQGFCGAGLLAVLIIALTAPAMVSPLTHRVAGAVADTVAIDISVGLGAAILAALANWIAGNIADTIAVCVTDYCGILGIVFLHKPSAVSSGQGRGTGEQCCSDNESSHDFFVHFHFKHSLFLDLGFIIEEIYGKIVTEVKK